MWCLSNDGVLEECCSEATYPGALLLARPMVDAEFLGNRSDGVLNPMYW